MPVTQYTPHPATLPGLRRDRRQGRWAREL